VYESVKRVMCVFMLVIKCMLTLSGDEVTHFAFLLKDTETSYFEQDRHGSVHIHMNATVFDILQYRGQGKKQNTSPHPPTNTHMPSVHRSLLLNSSGQRSRQPCFFSHNYCGINLSMGLSGKRERGIVQISNTLTHNVHAHTQVLMLAHRQTDNSVFLFSPVHARTQDNS